MKILAITPNYLPMQYSGGEMMLHDYLYALSSTHNIEVATTAQRPAEVYKHDEIPVNHLTNGNNTFRDLEIAARGFDAIFAHLGSVGIAQNICRIQNKPLFYIQHNTNKTAAIRRDPTVNVIYNASWYVDQLPYNPNRSMVGYPILYMNKYKQLRVKNRPNHVTLANANENKGGFQLKEIAERMPDTSFVATGGYGKSRLEDAPGNVRMLRNQDIKEIFKTTNILLMLSKAESFGRLGVEAQCAGIPVIASDLPGIREALGDGAVYVNRNEIDVVVSEINYLDLKLDYREKLIQKGYENVKRIEAKASEAIVQLNKMIEDATSESD